MITEPRLGPKDSRGRVVAAPPVLTPPSTRPTSLPGRATALAELLRDRRELDLAHAADNLAASILEVSHHRYGRLP